MKVNPRLLLLLAIGIIVGFSLTVASEKYFSFDFSGSFARVRRSPSDWDPRCIPLGKALSTAADRYRRAEIGSQEQRDAERQFQQTWSQGIGMGCW